MAEKDKNDRLYTGKPIIDIIIKNCKKLLTPRDCIVVDESIVPFQGRLKIRQYNTGKSHKYGLKVYKTTTDDGCVWMYKVYTGQDPQIDNLDKPGSVVIELCEELLDAGRMIIVDNFYTSLPLSEYLLQRKTDLCVKLVLKQIISSPKLATKYKRAFSVTQHERPHKTPSEALSIFVEAGLFRRQYEIIKNANENTYLYYSILQKDKQKCYPEKEAYRVTDTCAEIKLQSLLDHTAISLLIHLGEVLQLRNEGERSSSVLMCKWGCDGSQVQYKQKFQIDSDPDANLFRNSFVPLQLVYSKNQKKEVNPRALEFGLFILHARIRLFEFILNLVYNLPLKKWQLIAENDKDVGKQRKREIQKKFREKLSLIVDVPKPRFGTASDGNATEPQPKEIYGDEESSLKTDKTRGATPPATVTFRHIIDASYGRKPSECTRVSIGRISVSQTYRSSVSPPPQRTRKRNGPLKDPDIYGILVAESDDNCSNFDNDVGDPDFVIESNHNSESEQSKNEAVDQLVNEVYQEEINLEQDQEEYASETEARRDYGSNGQNEEQERNEQDRQDREEKEAVIPEEPTTSNPRFFYGKNRTLNGSGEKAMSGAADATAARRGRLRGPRVDE
ncbi:PiggyBac transposable element-derived protein 4 [Eumeta japonica]|uniref:PiggyBac transposable element-derived protein 4 n=1 Tax=Eumeta variegata TaxID=151549 RepID=A0A4C1TH26_EUMVA|nr:PiggyBac transposable element-derived protein 4 [Eumeta japonica]